MSVHNDILKRTDIIRSKEFGKIYRYSTTS